MPRWNRRTVLAGCTALTTSSVLAAIGSTVAQESDSDSANESESDDDPASGDDADDQPSSTAAIGDPNGWSSARGNAANSRYLPLEGSFPKPGTVVWRHEISHASAYHGDSVAVVDGRVYVLTGRETSSIPYYKTELRALDAETGDIEWQVDVEAQYRPTVLEDTLYLGGEGKVTAFDTADGSVRWQRTFDTDEWLASPSAVDGSVYVVAGGTCYALDAADGSVRWGREAVDVEPQYDEADDPIRSSFAHETTAVAGNSLYAITDRFSSDAEGYDGGIAALDPETGETQWAVAPEDGASYSLLATDDIVFAQESAGDTAYGYILDADTGAFVGESELTRAATADVRVVHDTSFPGGGKLTVTSPDSGPRWSADSVGFQAPLIARETLMAVRGDGIVGFDLETGDVEWEYQVDPAFQGFAAVDEGTIYARFDDEIVALRPGEDDPDDGDEMDLDLEVCAPPCGHVNGTIPFEVSVENRGDTGVETTIELAVSDVDRSTPIDLDGGDGHETTFTVGGDEIGEGDHEWIVTVGEMTETGTIEIKSDR
ncbi:PQQ-like beta-propeller repeat protein [Natronosalvus caseinilyticus]|uniref:PQQ-like beta-propeller repeat protein n=1 Tax=Natronosalvus caseinilyticus TaxID=2953747 RepID=UPI0028A90874|nr:PQQ-binding-like beta-propeller repeat protein [Natronosalvus caseinilyticus]